MKAKKLCSTKALNNLEALYRTDRGYEEAKVSPQIDLVQEPKIEVIFDIQEGAADRGTEQIDVVRK